MEKKETATRNEINMQLKQLYEQIGKEKDLLRIHKNLDDIFPYKPTDNYYTLVKASLCLKERKLDAVWETLYGKENWYFPGPYANLLAKVQYDASVASSHPYQGKLHKIMAYYAYIATQSRENEDIIFPCDDEFIQEAKLCYETETVFENETITKLAMDGELFTEEQKVEYLEYLFGAEYNLMNSVMGLLCFDVKEKLKSSERSQYDFFWNIVTTAEPNYGYIQQEIKEKEDGFLVVCDEFIDENHACFIEKMLKQLGKQVAVFDWNKATEIEITDFLEEKLKEKKYWNLLASQATLRYLEKTHLQAYVGCLSEYRGEAQMDRLCFGYLGKYTEYISRIYGYDYQEELEKKDRCLFSVVIPARNSAYTLKYTVQTVLNQLDIGTDEFEVVISDNSTNGNTEIKKMVEEIKDERIHYIKTPVDLPLQKSFEFAYGKAGGKYIIPLGSDDGMLPWALKVLKEMVLKYENENVIAWERGFFQWSESQSDQRGKFVIPRNYKKGNYCDTVKSGKQTLKEQIAGDGRNLYTIPMFYINTAFKRSYLKEMLEKSGSILDGYTQDVSMAVKSLLLNKSYVFMKYPLTIAGMADSSLGAAMGKESKTDLELERKLQNETPRGFGHTVLKTDFPFQVIASTEGLFWSELFRCYPVKLFYPVLKEILSEHDFRQTFITLTSCRSRSALDYVPLLEKLHYNAWSLDGEFGEWYDRVLYTAATQKLYYTEDDRGNNKIEAYKTGFNEGGGLTLDARMFEVANICEAVKLFQKITNL